MMENEALIFAWRQKWHQDLGAFHFPGGVATLRGGP